VYGQFIGEDEAGGFPSKYLGQGGLEVGGTWRDRWSWRGFSELAITKCRFFQWDDDFNCAYNHGVYQTGYRYRGRSVGHGSDNDSRILSTGILLVDDADTQWRLLMRSGALNRGGAPDVRNSLTPTRQDLVSLDLSHSRMSRFGRIDFGIGFERIDDALSGQTDNAARAFLQWQSVKIVAF
jgi:hypothetical protein